ncbi:MAG: Gfo/Idh/MocA family oxidoreductase [Verrucomicrobia bacterium]|nr:Gfo/Idh/MocA family oxidoreductase [Verrucomicrobiota bacterium]
MSTPGDSSATQSASPIGRRSFVKGLSLASLGVALGVNAAASAEPASLTTPAAPARRRRYVIVGTGHRHELYRDAIENDFKDTAELVGLCDKNLGRIQVAQELSAKNGAKVPPGYLAADFDRMLAETKPDTVIVTTVDATHHEYLVRAMEQGCDVITEKPMTTQAETCQKIVDTTAKTGRRCRVTFNYRYSPPRTQVKDILMSGEIGDILSVDFHWMLNTFHGADYFRRWHSQKKNSGGLMVHKATHHFDLVNWWLSAVPVTVTAVGKREFYTPEMAKRMGLEGHHERCLTCPEKAKCGFLLDLEKSPRLKQLYVDQEKYDGYFRDRCVFRPDIDIEDTMNVIVGYDNGATLSYSLNAFNSWEGYTIAFNGTKGRLEHTIVENVYVNGTDTVQGGIKPGGVTTKVYPLRGPVRTVKPWTGSGGHGGGDAVMLSEIFGTNPAADKYLRASTEHAGAYSCLVGIAANRCFVTGQPVVIADLVKGLKKPDYTPMPTDDQPLPMPPQVDIA